MGALTMGRVRRAGAAPGASSFVLRVERRADGRRRYLLHDLASGELHRFTQAVQLQRWLRRAGHGGLK